MTKALYALSLLFSLGTFVAAAIALDAFGLGQDSADLGTALKAVLAVFAGMGTAGLAFTLADHREMRVLLRSRSSR